MMNNVMKTGIYFGLWLAFVAGFISVRADDNAAQAAARAALEQNLKELDHSPASGTPSGAALVQPGQSATYVTDTVPPKGVTPQTSSAATTPVAAPVATAAPIKTPSTAALPTPNPTPAFAATTSSSPPVIVNSTNEIVNDYGTIYKNAQVEKVDSDGLIVSYTPAGGGLAMSKVDFDDLPAELQQRYEKK
jgi:hypothetical protein